MPNPKSMQSTIDQVLQAVGDRARAACVFGEVVVEGEMLVCLAVGAAEVASYRVHVDDGRVWTELVMADRWLSESIEADLMHTGDKLEELLEDELADLGESDPSVSFEHFRSDDMLFTFRTPIEIPPGGLDEIRERIALTLIAYEACFRNLGDMSNADSQANGPAR